MFRGSGTKPKVPIHQAIAGYAGVAVQNVWNTVLSETKDVRLYYANIKMNTLAEDIEIRVTIDGIEHVGTQTAVAGTAYHAYMKYFTAELYLNTAQLMIAQYTPIDCRTCKVEVRKTTANGANQLSGYAVYAKW